MSLDDELWRCGLEAYTAFDAHDSIAHIAIAANGIACPNLFYLLYGLHLVVVSNTIDSGNLAPFERDAEQALLLLGDVLQIGLLGQSLPRIENLSTADGSTPDAYVIAILQLGEVGFKAMLVQVVHFLLPRELLVARQRDDFHAWRHDEKRHIKAYLVVAGSRRAMGNGIGTYLVGIAGNGQGLEDALARHGDGIAVVAHDVAENHVSQ